MTISKEMSMPDADAVDQHQIIYKTIKDVYSSGVKDNIDWLQIQKSFVFNTHVFRESTYLYIPRRAFSKGSLETSPYLTVYTYPGGNLHFLPLDIEGNFLSCKNENNDLTQQHEVFKITNMSPVGDVKSPKTFPRCSEKSEGFNDIDYQRKDIFEYPNNVLDSENHYNNHDQVNGSKGLEFTDNGIKSNSVHQGKSSKDPKENTLMHQAMGDPVKVFKPILRNKKGHTIARSDASKISSKIYDKRFSIFTEQSYISMSGFVTFEELCNAHAKANKNLTKEDYLDMTHPIVNTKEIFPEDDTFKVVLRQRSKSEAEHSPRSSKTDSGLRNLPLDLEDGYENVRRLKACKSINDLDLTEMKEIDFLQIPEKFNKEYSLDSSQKHEPEKKRGKSLKPISLYSRLMKDVEKLLQRNEKIREYKEHYLRNWLGFNRFESRLIYYSFHGWSPNTINALGHQQMFLEDYSVQELANFLQSLGNRRLADYLVKYNVDGYLMKLIVLDDLLLDEQLFDESFLEIQQLVRIRREYFPKRSRCYAVSRRKDSNNDGQDNVIAIF